MKKRRVPSAVQAKQQPPKPNPFELKGSKRKFSVLGKPDNSSTKNVTKQREEAVNKVCLLLVAAKHAWEQHKLAAAAEAQPGYNCHACFSQQSYCWHKVQEMVHVGACVNCRPQLQLCLCIVLQLQASTLHRTADTLVLSQQQL
eukprot:GHRR01033386.1.p1 GENE.GHRR01033386.1~~GHRR01033386.1.p1  ORF type:complete len:144 (+),score=57.93 GHRR01033386.1:672-1103(+)